MTELEFVAAALAAYNGVMYYFWWDKPLNVLSTFAVYLLDENDNEPHDDSHSLDRTDHETSASHVAERSHSPLNPSRQEEATQEQINRIDRTDEQEDTAFLEVPRHRIWEIITDVTHFDLVNTEPVIATTHVPDFYALPIPVDSHGPRFFLSAIIATIGAQFGAIHCAAWSFAFPSTVEKVLWRIGATFITAMLILWHFGVLVAYLTVFLTRRFKRTNQAFDVFDDSLAGFVLCAGPILYIVAILFLLVVAVTALRHIPPTAFYQVEWLSFLPHI
ncbi:hypothetical protein CPC08DRAFT_762489 [Agrocybe pediades]|nr:hypothetical protein CPC08DRAFT_762489 [Agrocybe pediades]